jgi:hypothetical protein
MKSLFRISMFCGLTSLAARAQEISIPDSTRAPQAQLTSPQIDSFLLRAEMDRTRNKLSTLWTVVALNMIGADVLSSYLPGADAEVVDFAGGEDNVQYFMLGGAVIYEIPISMIFLSKYLPYTANRWANVAAATLATATVWGGGSTHPHYLFAAGAETLAMSYIVWTALKWPDPEAEKRAQFGPGKKHDVGLDVDPRTESYGLKYSYRF